MTSGGLDTRELGIRCSLLKDKRVEIRVGDDYFVEMVAEASEMIAAIIKGINWYTEMPINRLFKILQRNLFFLPNIEDPISGQYKGKVIGSVIYLDDEAKAKRCVYACMSFNTSNGVEIVPVRVSEDGEISFGNGSLPLIEFDSVPNSEKPRMKGANLLQILQFMAQNPDLAPWLSMFMVDVFAKFLQITSRHS